MTIRTLNWCSVNILQCGGSLPTEAYICVPASIVSPAVDTEHGFVQTTITGVRASTCNDPCGSCKWIYTLSYDDTQLIEGYALSQAYIINVLCSDCLTDFIIDNSSGGLTCEEVTECVNISEEEGNQIVVNPDGLFVPESGGGFITAVSDTNSIDLTVTGTTLSGDSKISATANNQISIAGDGLFVPKASGLAVTDTSSIDLTLVAGSLSGVSKISVDAGNQVSIHADGLFVPSNFITAISDTSSIDLSVGGTTLSGVSKISADAGNQIVIHADGLFVPGAGLNIGALTEYSPTFSTNTDVTVSLSVTTDFTNKFYYQVIGQDLLGNILVTINLNYRFTFSGGTPPTNLRITHPFTFIATSAPQMYRGFSYRVLNNGNKEDSQFIADPALNYFQVYLEPSSNTWSVSTTLNCLYVSGNIWVSAIAP